MLEEERREYRILYRDLKSVDRNMEQLVGSFQDLKNETADTCYYDGKTYQEDELLKEKENMRTIERRLSGDIMERVAHKR